MWCVIFIAPTRVNCTRFQRGRREWWWWWRVQLRRPADSTELAMDIEIYKSYHSKQICLTMLYCWGSAWAIPNWVYVCRALIHWVYSMLWFWSIESHFDYIYCLNARVAEAYIYIDFVGICGFECDRQFICRMLGFCKTAAESRFSRRTSGSFNFPRKLIALCSPLFIQRSFCC